MTRSLAGVTPEERIEPAGGSKGTAYARMRTLRKAEASPCVLRKMQADRPHHSMQRPPVCITWASNLLEGMLQTLLLSLHTLSKIWQDHEHLDPPAESNCFLARLVHDEYTVQGVLASLNNASIFSGGCKPNPA
jgi:hypothetical protein